MLNWIHLCMGGRSYMNIQFLNLPREHTRSIWREVPRSTVYSVFQKSDGISGDVGMPRRAVSVSWLMHENLQSLFLDSILISYNSILIYYIDRNWKLHFNQDLSFRRLSEYTTFKKKERNVSSICADNEYRYHDVQSHRHFSN